MQRRTLRTGQVSQRGRLVMSIRSEHRASAKVRFCGSQPSNQGVTRQASGHPASYRSSSESPWRCLVESLPDPSGRSSTLRTVDLGFPADSLVRSSADPLDRGFLVSFMVCSLHSPVIATGAPKVWDQQFGRRCRAPYLLARKYSGVDFVGVARPHPSAGLLNSARTTHSGIHSMDPRGLGTIANCCHSKMANEKICCCFVRC